MDTDTNTNPATSTPVVLPDSAAVAQGNVPRTCTIQGTHTRYQMKKVTRANEMDKHKTRVTTSTWDPSLYDRDTQLQLLAEIQRHLAEGSKIEDHVGGRGEIPQILMKKEVDTKLSGYRFQDQHKKRQGRNISFQETIEKLLDSKLQCYYCHRPCNVFYERVREMSQWSLDRIDNDLCHSVDNVVVACLQCNLHRKTINSKKFKDTKEMKSIRLLDTSATIPTGGVEDEALQNTETSVPVTSTRLCPKLLQKLADQVVVDECVVVPIQEKLP